MIVYLNAAEWLDANGFGLDQVELEPTGGKRQWRMETPARRSWGTGSFVTVGVIVDGADERARRLERVRTMYRHGGAVWRRTWWQYAATWRGEAFARWLRHRCVHGPDDGTTAPAPPWETCYDRLMLSLGPEPVDHAGPFLPR